MQQQFKQTLEQNIYHKVKQHRLQHKITMMQVVSIQQLSKESLQLQNKHHSIWKQLNCL